MKLEKITSRELKQMFRAAADHLSENMELVNSLNVFPVPDGDTGTNMNMTFQSGVARMESESSEHVGELLSSLAKGLLMGARGNSGVILSQIFRGFSQAVAHEAELDRTSFAKAFLGGVEAAYKAVMKPVEGTILTVARESALEGERKAQETDDVVEIMQAVVDKAQAALATTPDFLPVLKQVGVVDSGGKGLLCIYEGFLAGLTGQVPAIEEFPTHKTETAKHAHAIFDEMNEHPMSLDDITYGFCTEIMVRIGQGPTKIKDFDYEDFRNELDKRGDSLLVVADDELVKVHIHTENPGEIMQMGQEFGELIKIKVENMREQVRGLESEEASLKAQNQQVANNQPREKFAVIAVASGEGLNEIFKSMGVKEVLSGGQTMNPSTEDFVKAIERANADHVILLPNNKNIVMAANQAAEVAEVPTMVVATPSITQGIAAMMMFNPEMSLEENQEAMAEYALSQHYGQITNAIRDTKIDDVEIKENDFMAILDGKIVYSLPVLEDALTQLIEGMITDESELVTVIVGEPGSEELAETVAEQMEAKHPDLEFEIIQGDQPVYHYFVAVD